MDIFIQNVPLNATHAELRLFLKPKLETLEILAFDVNKHIGKGWAVLTVANEIKGQKFLADHGSRHRGVTPQSPLVFRQHFELRCMRSNKSVAPNNLKFKALNEKEQRLLAKAAKAKGEGALDRGPRNSQPTVSFNSFSTGVWDYNTSGGLVFQEKMHDQRTGTITFGKFALAVFLKGVGDNTCWGEHCRVDIPYGAIEHTIPSCGKQVEIFFTLRSPPRFFNLPGDADLRAYSAEHSSSITGLPQGAFDLSNPTNPGFQSSLQTASAMLAGFGLNPLIAKQKPNPMVRLCGLYPGSDQTSALCMVYRIVLPDLQVARQAWNFIKETSALPLHLHWKRSFDSISSRPIEEDYAVLNAVLELNHSDVPKDFDFAVRFQLLALVLEGTITPINMSKLIQEVWKISAKHGSRLTSLGVRKLGTQIPTPSPMMDAVDFSLSEIIKMLKDNIDAILTKESFGGAARSPKSFLMLTHRVTITPTGMLLRGPDPGITNRVLRKYSKHSEYFLRVTFADEDGISVLHDSRASQEKVYERFRQLLRQGIIIAGRKYEFLGFSNSSLKYHAVWFMAPFYHNDSLIRSKDIIEDLGDFTHIQCSAKCAARIGQAFSDTMFAVSLPQSALIKEDHVDIKRNGRCFSDGCGTISQSLLSRIWKALPYERSRREPTVFQIRYRGAKGVVSLDSSLGGDQLLIRSSMTKFNAKHNPQIFEICGASYSPLPAYLNHQFIKILEDLGVPEFNFFSLQNDAINKLEKVSSSPRTMANFLESTHCAVAAKVPELLRLLDELGIDPRTDRFLTDIVEVAIMTRLRDLKYRARIGIEKGYVLYGIMDETNTLRENEVYIPLQSEDERGRLDKSVLVQDCVVVTRAPALHPGDVQIVRAVEVPENCHLKSLHNCIVFSQQGSRDLPSKLGGGDLDGDLFQVFYDERLRPHMVEEPADYPPVVALDLERPVQVDDIVDFFIQFMQSDRLGQISTKHKIRADRLAAGTKDGECIILSELASEAVDFSKSGVPVDMMKIPKGADHIRPDFMATSPGLVLNELGAAELRELEEDDIDEPDGMSLLDPDRNRIRYYESQKVLGKLYRNPRLNETNFAARMKREIEKSCRAMGNQSLMEILKRHVDKETSFFEWKHHEEYAIELREDYEDNMLEIMDSLRTHRGQPLTELEVFSGSIMGKKERAPSRYLREANREVKERFDRDVSAIIRRIKYGDGEGDDGEALPRAIACFNVALEPTRWENTAHLKSWKYVTAAVCLEQLREEFGGRL